MVDNTWIFDIEVFPYDWLTVFKNVNTGDYFVTWNDNEAVTEFMKEDPFIGGFNNKHYDNHIIKAILCNFTPEQIKYVNDQIIVNEVNGWQIPELKQYRCFFHSFDLMDDCQDGVSLKGIEAHLGLPIEETEVDFNIDRPLTQEEREKTEKYCKYDVDTTEILYKLRQGYLENKAELGRSKGIDIRDALYMTNAKITAVYLDAKQPDKTWDDERQYHYPDKLLKEYIPDEVFQYFDRIHDPSIPDDQLWKEKLNIDIDGCPVTIGFGGIHGAIPNYMEECTEDREIDNADVASYYPHMITIPLDYDQEVGYCSRAIPSPQIYIDTLNERIADKRAGRTAQANAKKLVLNTTYGAMLNGHKGTPFNDLYDPLMARSICITGQLLLLELSVHLIRECPTLKIIQLNTDGIMASFDKSDRKKWEEILAEWQSRTGFELEEDHIRKIVQRDVNNYIEIPIDDGKPKVKGGVLVRGILTNGKMDFTKLGLPQWDNLSGGAWKINNEAVVIARAVQDYFVNGTSAEDTIYGSDNILDFQIISKVGGKYTHCYQMVGDQEVRVQKVNRVYAVDDYNLGTIYKVHAQTKGIAKVGGLPAHCIVDNDNHLDVTSIDRDWYVREADRHIREFLGMKKPKRNTRRVNALKKEALEILGGELWQQQKLNL